NSLTFAAFRQNICRETETLKAGRTDGPETSRQKAGHADGPERRFDGWRRRIDRQKRAAGYGMNNLPLFL
ncbi:hypothetical protein, partial [Paenibacillus cisolokensis]|uniref:hypothetical protein n=1 Tax=Paenibacillus cisolokensis TaxID=1658519 RepID=UPI001BCB6534